MSELISNLTHELITNFNSKVEREPLEHMRGYLIAGRRVDIVLAENLSDYEMAYLLVHSGAHIILGHLERRFKVIHEIGRGAEEKRRGMPETIERVYPELISEHQTADILTEPILK